MGILLTLIAYLLTATFTFFGVLYALFKTIFKVDNYFKSLAISLDQMGNVSCQYLLNDLLIKKSAYRFGNPDETISSVLGKNKIMGNLTWLGMKLDNVLNKIEPDHSIKSIEEDEKADI